MKRTRIQAQAYYGEPVSGQRQTLVEGVSVQAGGMPYEGEVQSVEAVKPQGRKAKPKGV